MGFDIVISIIALVVGIVVIVRRLDQKIDKTREEMIDLTDRALDLIQNNWETDSDKLVDVLDEEIKEIKRDIFSVAKSPNVAKKTLKEKYKDLIE